MQLNQIAGIASPGIQILRPLLDVSKETLIATCARSNTPWFHDGTNDDPTLTLRNATRHLLTSDRLPRALRKASLIEMTTRVKQSLEQHRQYAEDALKSLKTIRLDLRSGNLTVELPPSLSGLKQDPQPPAEALRSLQTRQLFFAPLAHAVSPNKGYATNKVEAITFHLSTPNKNIENEIGTRPSRFTAAGVDWNPLLAEATAGCLPNVGYLWSLTRELPKRKNSQPVCQWRASGASFSWSCSGVGTRPASFGTWQLFDGRFWLRVWDKINPMVTARFLREADMKQFFEDLPTGVRARLRKALKSAAPKKTRLTLPALALPDNGPVLALPSFGVQLPTTCDSLRWQVLYKSLKLGEGFQDPCQISGKMSTDNAPHQPD